MNDNNYFLRKANNWVMASDYPGPHRPPSTHIPHPAGIGCFSQPLRSDGYMGQGDQHGLSSHSHPHPHPHPHPHHVSSYQSHDLHEAIQRELEKERIREEIIMSEILRRRALEAEVRRELMMERELALQGRSNGFGSPSRMGLDLPMRLPLVETRAEGRFHEERITITQRNSLNNRRESDLSVSLPFQSASDDVRAARNLEVKPVLEGVREKQKIILQAKPIKNITGAKRAGYASESQSDGNLKKKVKEEWSCALCQVSPTSERGLNEHLKGKKHKTKEAELRAQKAGKNYSIGLTTKKVAKPIQGSGTVDPGTDSEMKFTSESSPFSKSGDARSTIEDLPSLQENLTSDNLKKKESVVPQKVKKNDKPEKKNYKFWCEICQIGVANQKVMNLHEMGKKHRRQLDKRNKCSGVGPSQRDGAVEETM